MKKKKFFQDLSVCVYRIKNTKLFSLKKLQIFSKLAMI